MIKVESYVRGFEAELSMKLFQIYLICKYKLSKNFEVKKANYSCYLRLKLII